MSFRYHYIFSREKYLTQLGSCANLVQDGLYLNLGGYPDDPTLVQHPRNRDGGRVYGGLFQRERGAIMSEKWHVLDVMVYDEDGNRVADCDSASDVMSRKANARLIAACPELLEALKAMLGTCAVNLDDQEPEDEAVYMQARAVIARAEGQS